MADAPPADPPVDQAREGVAATAKRWMQRGIALLSAARHEVLKEASAAPTASIKS